MNKVYILSLISICFAAHNVASAVWPFKSAETKVSEAVMESDLAKFGKSYPALIGKPGFVTLKSTLYQESIKRYEFRSTELSQALASNIKRNWSALAKGSLLFRAAVASIGCIGLATAHATKNTDKSKNTELFLASACLTLPLLVLSAARAAVTIGHGFRYQNLLADTKDSAKKIMDHLAPTSHK